MTKSTPQFVVRLLVKGREITKYEHITTAESKGANWVTDPDIYVEGREGSEFEIELINNTDKLVLMIPSVDGLSVTDGKPASEDSQGYLVRPNSSVKVPGWTLDNDSVAKFVFAEKKKSYAANHEDHASTENVGVIGCLVYSRKVTEGEKIDELLERIKELEKVKPIIINPSYPWHYWNDYYWINRPYLDPYYTTLKYLPTYGSTLIGSYQLGNISGVSVSNTMDSLNGGSNMMNTSYSANGSAGPQSCVSVFSSQSVNAVNNCVSPDATHTFGQFSVADNVDVTKTMTEEDFALGIGFGESSQFKTNNVSFDRDELLETIVIYYDTRKNLEKKGIIISKPKEEKKMPSAFPKMGCKPPKDWAEKA